MRHLTYTGINAGATLCGKPRDKAHDDDEQTVHYVLAPQPWLDSPSKHNMCPDCMKVINEGI